MNQPTELEPCPSCGKNAAVLEEDSGIFKGQSYHDRYPIPVATQSNGFRVRCEYCAFQTCWWHFAQEAIAHWNTRTLQPVSGLVETLAKVEWVQLKIHNQIGLVVGHYLGCPWCKKALSEGGHSHDCERQKALALYREGEQSPVGPLAHWPKWKSDIFYKMVAEQEKLIHQPKGEE